MQTIEITGTLPAKENLLKKRERQKEKNNGLSGRYMRKIFIGAYK
jgi:hypothetical protein